MKRYIGERFGKLVLKKYLLKGRWLVKCDCGKEKIIKNINNVATGNTNSCGCFKENLKRLNLKNKIFGSLKGLKFLHTKKGVSYWKFLCLSCHEEFVCQGRAVTRKSRPLRKCRGCSYKDRDSGFNGIGEVGGSYLSTVRQNAKSRRIQYEIDPNYIWDLFLSQNQKCALSNISITLDKNYRKRDGQTGSLDRIDSSKGYIRGNVQWVHKDINKIKYNFNTSYFVKLCQDISKWNQNYDYSKIELLKTSSRFKGYKNISYYHWNNIIRNAKSRNFNFNIAIEDGWDIYIKQGGLCSLSGRRIVFDIPSKQKNTTASLNRIDSNIGYELNNVEWVHKDINHMLWNYNQDYFKYLCKQVSLKF